MTQILLTDLHLKQKHNSVCTLLFSPFPPTPNYSLVFIVLILGHFPSLSSLPFSTTLFTPTESHLKYSNNTPGLIIIPYRDTLHISQLSGFPKMSPDSCLKFCNNLYSLRLTADHLMTTFQRSLWASPQSSICEALGEFLRQGSRINIHVMTITTI